MPDRGPNSGSGEVAAPAGHHAHQHDGRLVRRVRLQLVAWSAGSTLLVLVILGAALYGAVATTLASGSEQLLRDRAALMSATSTTLSIQSEGGTAGAVSVGTSIDPALPGFVVAGPFSGTLAMVLPAAGFTESVTVSGGGVPPASGTMISGTVSGAAGAIGGPGGPGAPLVQVVTGSAVGGVAGAGVGAGSSAADPGPVGSGTLTGPPDPEGYAAAAQGLTTIHETTYQGNPVRVLSMPQEPPAGATVVGSASGSASGASTAAAVPVGVIQVIADRTAELRTLNVLVVVLLGGGLIALLVAGFLGWLYATRALTPIRASLQRQREFAADTSHELRTPLAVIRAGVARVRQQPDARVSEVGPALDAVNSEAVRLAALVDDLLAMARTDAGSTDLDLRPVDLADVAAEAMATLEPLASERGVHLALDVEPASMRGDPDRLRRLVTVLVDNAIRHGRHDGTVTVTVRSGSLVVDDDGPGVPAAERSRIFDRFWRGTATTSGGSGLGLAIAAWIVERHDGRITVGDSPAAGARFNVSLPVS